MNSLRVLDSTLKEQTNLLFEQHAEKAQESALAEELELHPEEDEEVLFLRMQQQEFDAVQAARKKTNSELIASHAEGTKHE